MCGWVASNVASPDLRSFTRQSYAAFVIKAVCPSAVGSGCVGTTLAALPLGWVHGEGKPVAKVEKDACDGGTGSERDSGADRSVAGASRQQGSPASRFRPRLSCRIPQQERWQAAAQARCRIARRIPVAAGGA